MPKQKKNKSKKAKPITRNKPIPKHQKSTVKLKSSFRLLKESIQVIVKNYRILGLIMGVYALIYLVLVLGFSVSGNATTLSGQLKSTFHGSLGSIAKSFNVYGLLLNSSSSSTAANPSSGVFQGVLFVVISLVLIYSFRKLYNGSKLGLKEAYYNSTYPLIPYTLVLILVTIELIPMTLGLYLYSTVISGGIAVGTIERLIWIAITLALVLVSVYFISSSIFALFIISLEHMTPMKALRSARNLVRKRRTSIALKILFVPFFILISISIIMLIIILSVPVIANWTLQILLMLSLVFIFSYLYNLYRNLIDD